MLTLSDLPLRDDLRGREPYGAPQLAVDVALNVNENSHPVPPTVVDAVRRAVDAQLRGLNRYPDREFTRLRELLLTYVQDFSSRQSGDGSTPAGFLTAEWLWAANGSNEVLSHILQAFGGPGRTALGFVPSYSMHPLITQSTGARWIAVDRGEDFSLSAETAAAAVREHQPDVVFLCTPNNPTGGGLPAEVIEAVLHASTGIVIVDEAYAEFARPGYTTAVHLLRENPRLVVSRTMSKAFAFAGVRLGYAIAHPAVTDALRLVRLPYHLSALTQAAACAALEHTPVLLDNVEALIAERDRMVAALTELGFDVAETDANFVLFGGVSDTRLLWQRLLDAGVLIRDIGIPGHLRVNAGTTEETTAFIEAISAIVAAHPETLENL
ncbi:histidinol-phosphate transaminase [Brevibacterium luteolum]|uniref:Histidinol-phosphate aminotransferase n=1 Tax=Brevibacterium luteolum TaxID=199591 RepID=A0A849AZB2_9MICO|nr:histidinol-phosphate aminotransferase [Brevibacterium luteolum]NNG78396.1 histidinol-phosphate transaminase [Brevibacterium luteolum]